MSNRIFETVLKRKIENFALTFIEDSKSIFFDESKLIHPGEYGKYRENSLKDLLKLFTKHKISDGFIITPDDKVSTQLDVVVYKNDEAPLLENNHINFFSIESVLAIGEVKSTLNKTDFTNALKKLSISKKLHENKRGRCLEKKYNFFEHDELISFLVCASTSFDPQSIDFEKVYLGIDKKYRHNFILIIEKGVIGHKFSFSNLDDEGKQKFSNQNGNLDATIWYEYPKYTFQGTEYGCEDVFHPLNKEDKYYHIKLFLTQLSQALSVKNLYETDYLYYTDLPVSPVYKK